MTEFCVPTRRSKRHSLATDAFGEADTLYDDTITVPATPIALDQIHAALDRCMRALDRIPAPPAADWRDMFRTAVAEIATNVIRHAYPPDSPQGSFQLRLAVTADGLIALFTDGGSAFDASQPREAVDPESLPEGGLGLMVVRAAVDTLEYSRDADAGENTWRLTKLFPDAS